MPSPSNFKIAILGAGPAGLTLASLLTASPHPFNFTIFELREKPEPSSVNIPSGSLDLQEDLGQAAIKACGLYPRFLEVENECTEQIIITDKNATVQLSHTGSGHPEISRNAIAQLLLSSVPDGTVRWNTKVLSVKQVKDSDMWSVEFIVGNSTSSETYDLVVGADGAWSRARSAIPSAVQPVYSGVCCVTLVIPSLTEKDPDLDTQIGGGTFAACGENKAILSQRGRHGSARIYLMLHSNCQADYQKELQSFPHDETNRPNPALDANRLILSLPTNHKDLHRYLLTNPDFFKNWSEDLKRFLTIACEAQPSSSIVDARPLYMLPLDTFPHPHTKGIALVGDAAHLMTPFAGLGVNIAMADSLSLAKQLESLFSSPTRSEEKFGADLDKALIAFEQEAHPRGKDAMRKTWMNVQISYEDDSPRRLIQVMSGR